MSDLPVLKGTNVTLRRPSGADAKARFALGRDAEIHRMFGGSRAQLAPLTLEQATTWLQSLQVRPFAWIIACPNLIGEIRLDNLDPADRRATLAVGIFDSQKLGHGLGTEAMDLVLAYAFDRLGLHRIGVRVLSYNHRAIRAYERCGFVIEGTERQSAYVDGDWHDDVIMGLLAHEFERRARAV